MSGLDSKGKLRRLDFKRSLDTESICRTNGLLMQEVILPNSRLSTKWIEEIKRPKECKTTDAFLERIFEETESRKDPKDRKSFTKEAGDKLGKSIFEGTKRLARRIYRAQRSKRFKDVIKLQSLMLTNKGALMLAGHKAFNNKGSQTPGIDGKLYETVEEKVRLLSKIQRSHKSFKAQPVKRIYIPKANGSKRPLGIPTIEDKVRQALYLQALEPQCEAMFEENSYGPKRSCHQAIKEIHKTIKPTQWILEGDIKGCFDNISHKFLLEHIHNTKLRHGIRKWLKAGYTEAKGKRSKITRPNKGTPQGGIISPILANIALQDLGKQLKRIIPTSTTYADDFVVICETEMDAIRLYAECDDWLRPRGLELSNEKTSVTPVDFLGFENGYMDQTELVRTPSQKSFNRMVTKLSTQEHIQRFAFGAGFYPLQFFR